MDGILRSRMRYNPGSFSSRRQVTRDSSSVHKTSDARIGNFERKDGFFARKTKPITPDGRALGRQSRAARNPIDMTIEEKPSRKNKKSNKRSLDWKRVLKRTVIGVLLLGLIVGGYLGAKGFLRARQIFKGGGDDVLWSCEPNVDSLKQEGDGRINFLLLGKGGPEQTDSPDLTDTIIVASVDPCNNEAGLLSIPRDLAVKMESGETNKINAVYALTKMASKADDKSDEEAEQEAIEAIENAVENVVGLRMDRYIMLDFTAFEQAVDAVGGITIDVQKPVSEQMRLKGKQYRLDVPTGTQEFDGLRALAYTRSRYTSARGDFDRSERQREVIVALREKVFSLGTFSNPLKISQLMDAFGTRVRTNINGNDEIGKLYTIGQAIDASRIKSVSLVDEPNVLIGSGGASLGLGSVQVPKAGLYRYDDIRAFVRTTFVDGFIKKENAQIAVLNGTTVANLAKTKGELLKSYGYNVSEVGDAPTKNNPSTIIIDLKKKDTKLTKRYLELRFKTTATTKLPEGYTPPENADFVIIVGQNETSNR